ncbi:MAG: OB-fold nucleic acid binding domain-containing protein [Nanoarchaeota archaeon]
MDEKRLKHVSILVIVIGMSGLLYLSYVLEPKLVNINDISDEIVGSKVKIAGIVDSVHERGKVYFVTVSDASGKILAVSFDGLPVEVWDGSNVEVIGNVKIYKGELEIIIEGIKTF